MVENDPTLHMVDSLERGIMENFEDTSSSIHKVKWDCIVSLYFWSKEIGLEEHNNL